MHGLFSSIVIIIILFSPSEVLVLGEQLQICGTSVIVWGLEKKLLKSLRQIKSN